MNSPDNKNLRSFLELRLKDQPYAVPVELVREINRVNEFTPLPNSAPHVCGVMNLRGQVLPVIDLNVRLGLARTQLTRESCVVVVEGIEGIVGMLVDGVARVLNFPKENLLPPPETCHLKDHTMITGVGKENDRLITLLDVVHCLASVADLQPYQAPEDHKNLTDTAVKLLS